MSVAQYWGMTVVNLNGAVQFACQTWARAVLPLERLRIGKDIILDCHGVTERKHSFVRSAFFVCNDSCSVSLVIIQHMQ